MSEEMGQPDQQPGSGKKIVIAVVLLLMIMAGGIAAYFFLFSAGADEEVIKTRPQPADSEEMAVEGKKEIIRLSKPLFTAARDYTINLRDGKHSLKLSLVFVLEEPTALDFLVQRFPLIDDMVISLLYNMATDDIRARAGIELLKRELFKKANSIYTQEFLEDLESGDIQPVKKILFKEFLIN